MAALPAVQNDKIRELLGGLGKATMRGVRKCHACGTYNGTRGMSCKNKNCNVVFKQQEKGKKCRSIKCRSLDAVQITTGSARQLFSIRARDRGADHRGFVEVPATADVIAAADDGTQGLTAAYASCYVDDCFRATDSPAYTCAAAAAAASAGASSSGTAVVDACVHMKQAMCSLQKATPLPTSELALDSLRLPADAHQSVLSLMAAAASGSDVSAPLVQRVSKSVMVVRCAPDAQCPVGFVHCGFYESSKSSSAKCQPTDHKIVCTCKDPKPLAKSAATLKEDRQRCAHYYACLCAFANDDELSKEFAFCLHHEAAATVSSDGWIPGSIPGLLDQGENLDVIVAQMSQDMENEVATAAAELDQAQSPRLEGPDTKDFAASIHNSLVFDSSARPAKKRRRDSPTSQPSEVAAVLHALSPPPPLHPSATVAKQLAILRRGCPVANRQTAECELQSMVVSSTPPPPLLRPAAIVGVEEASTSLTFVHWLASVTERINQTMHYQFSGYPDPLVFHAPQMFFDCLQQRISAGSKKKRLPNFTTSFQRSDAPPIGIFMKYTWHITTIGHVRHIFDTPQVPLELTRSFMENKDGTYSLGDAAAIEMVESNSRSKKNQLRIKPHELRTFLRVGKATCPNPKDALPFVIEWIPDILPQCKIGELRIKFEYGHQRNGVVEHRDLIASSIEIQAIAV